MESHGILPMPPGISAEDFIGAGSSGICFRFPGTDKVIKIPLTDDEEGDRCQVEVQAYERMQRASNRPLSILTYYGRSEYGIEVAYASHGSVRQYRAKGGQVSEELLHRWADQASEALIFCHECDILHADINCRNFFIDSSLNLLLADFAGSSLDSKQPLVSYSRSHRRPAGGGSHLAATVQTEIFAFGSFLYELVTGTEPSIPDEGLRSCPDVTGLSLGTIITDCWNDRFASMKEVRERIREDAGFLGNTIFLSDITIG